jgi:ketol-acid reductoisomerase
MANGGGKAGIIETNFREETETELFGELRDGKLLTIRSALLGFNEDAKFHAPRLSVALNR